MLVGRESIWCRAHAIRQTDRDKGAESSMMRMVVVVVVVVVVAVFAVKRKNARVKWSESERKLLNERRSLDEQTHRHDLSQRVSLYSASLHLTVHGSLRMLLMMMMLSPDGTSLLPYGCSNTITGDAVSISLLTPSSISNLKRSRCKNSAQTPKY